MNKISRVVIALLLLTTAACKQNDHKELKDGLYAELETSKGAILLELDYEKTPVTVANFITLAEGNNPFVKQEFKGKNFYDGVSFHRVIADFMIQTGDPSGTGSGDTGYMFKDEITDLKHDKPGVLSMANSGPDTNSSQFFITHVPTPWLDGKHTVFGRIVDSTYMNVVNAIVQGHQLTKVTIIRKGEVAKKFNAVKVFTDYFKAAAENKAQEKIQEEANKKEYAIKFEKIISEKLAYFETIKNKAIKLPSGVRFKIIAESKGIIPKDGAQVYMKFAGYLSDGTVFETSEADIAQKFGKFNPQKAQQNGYSPTPYTVGDKQMIPGLAQAIKKLKIGDKAVIFIPSSMAFGEQGAGDIIPPNADLIFEIQLIDKI